MSQPLPLTYAMAVEAKAQMPPPNLAPTSRMKYVHASYETITGQVHIDQTGTLYIASTSGNKDIFYLYADDENYIDAIPIPSRTKHQILKA